jgi:hypothetical protein
MEWVSIGLSLSAVAILLRYAARPRCPLCARRHDRRVVVVAHEPRPEASSSTSDRRPIRWRADPLVSLPAPDTDVASLN